MSKPPADVTGFLLGQPQPGEPGEMRIVHTPEPKHRCGPNNRGHMGMTNWNEPPGTVIECSVCEKSWVAYRPRGEHGYMGVLWRREGIFERRRRLKKKPFNTN